MDEWSPHDAIKAYLHTLQLCKNDPKQKDDEKPRNNNNNESSKMIEPNCTEFVSALAAGKRSQLILQLSSQGITHLTIALAAAAKQTRGRLVCLLLSPHNADVDDGLSHLAAVGLSDVVEIINITNSTSLCQVVGKYVGVDFAVVDFKIEDHLKICEVLNLNPRGSTVLANNVRPSQIMVGFKDGEFLQPQVMRMGGTINLTIGFSNNTTRFVNNNNNNYNHNHHTLRNNRKMIPRKYKRFQVTFEN